MTERQAIIQGFRELADFLTAHPTVPITKHTMNEFLDTRDEWEGIRSAPGTGWTERASDEFFVLRRTFAGGVAIEVNAERPTEPESDDTPDPSTHAFVADTHFSDCCKVCGENESAHG